MTEPINGKREVRNGVMVTRLRSGDGATAVVADHGAHLLSWCPADATEAIFLSQTSRYGDGEAIRGGVPIIFPQFGERGCGKRHGIARIRDWRFVGAALNDGWARARWMLSGRLSNAETPAGPSDVTAEVMSCLRVGEAAPPDSGGPSFLLTLDVQIAGDLLELALTVANPLTNAAPDAVTAPLKSTGTLPTSAVEQISSATLHFHAALHTYLRIPDLAMAGVQGLQGRRYTDQVLQGMQETQSVPILTFDREVDRIYPDAPSSLSLQSPARIIIVEQTGFADTVVWNPGADKAAALPDLHADGCREFVCIEAATVMRPISLLQGEHWRGVQRLRLA